MTDQLLTADDVCRALAISRSTLYELTFFRQRRVRVGKRGVRWTAEAVREYVAQNSAAPRPALRRAG